MILKIRQKVLFWTHFESFDHNIDQTKIFSKNNIPDTGVLTNLYLRAKNYKSNRFSRRDRRAIFGPMLPLNTGEEQFFT